MKNVIFLIIFLTFANANWKSFLKDMTNQQNISKISVATNSNDQITAIKEALKEGAKYAIKKLSKKDGFLSNPQVEIPLPPSLRSVANIVKKYGGKRYVDSFKASINHAAEKAVPLTYDIFENSIKKMSIRDAKKLLKGKDGSITRFFREKNSKLLYDKIYPIVKNSIRDINVMQYYNGFKNYYVKNMPKTDIEKNNNSLFGNILNMAKQTGIKRYIANLSEDTLDDYVTKKSIDGIFYMIAKEESKIRQNPLSYSSNIVKKVFSAYMKK